MEETDQAWNQDANPCFFQVIVKGLNTEAVKIPPEFVKHLRKDFSDKAILTGPSGEQLQVDIYMKGESMFMEDGWKQFCVDNELGDNEFLIFRYDGDMCFNVQVFNKNGLERLSLPASRTKQETAIPVCSMHLHQHKPCQEGRDLPKRKKRSLLKGSSSKHPSSTEAERLEACKAESFTSKYPYFKACMKRSNVEIVFLQPIPTSFARSYLPNSRTEVILLNSEGKHWEVTYVSDKSHMLCKGWKAFVFDNELKIGDICIFELVAKRKMRVHIFPDVEK
ncbi:B3 domain-containing protein [Quillaja saponaria]|uniref:B3 domain-containing protein n=1 Tax=Quillaja saponaria TaxID=32244 RepID=A0AAD7KUI9_QUISA|nr:B3 domain-containing protein [Quillaja saponaria]